MSGNLSAKESIKNLRLLKVLFFQKYIIKKRFRIKWLIWIIWNIKNKWEKKLLQNTIEERMIFISNSSIEEILEKYSYLKSAAGLRMEYCTQQNIKNLSFIRKRLVRLAQKIQISCEELLFNFPSSGNFIFKVFCRVKFTNFT